MGYKTEFFGKFDFDKPVSKEFAEYINRFSNTRRMKRRNDAIKTEYPNWKDYCFNGELGKQGEYFAHDDGINGQTIDRSVIDCNKPSKTQPSLWCQWVITNDLEHLKWNGDEQFYEYDRWLKYLINNFIKPSGYTLNGSVDWQGEDLDDEGTLIVNDNVITIKL